MAAGYGLAGDGWMTVVLAGLLAAATAAQAEGRVVSQPHVLHNGLGPGAVYQGIRLRGAVELRPEAIDGVGLAGLSGLAWDDDEGLLYALSDRGRIFHLRPRFEHGMLTAVEGLRGFHLRSANGRYLPRKLADSEGMAVINAANGVPGDSQLVISFEQVPRIMVFKPDGHWLASYALPTALELADHYADPNQELESVAMIPGVGPLTGPERPFWGEAGDGLRLYDLEGGQWRYALSDDTNAALVDLAYAPAGTLLALERSFVSPFHPLRIRLRRIALPLPPGKDAALEVTDIALMDSHRGWHIDNFEGLAHHRGRRFFMVSDDNERSVQKTLLVYFELLPGGD